MCDEKWIAYFKEHQALIAEWIDTVTPQNSMRLKELMVSLETEADRKMLYLLIYKLLSKSWHEAPDSPAIRTPGFFKLCDLLDGGYLSED